MPGNIRSLVLGLLALVWPGPWTRDEAANRVRSTLPVALGFFVGCAVGAASVARLGLWAFSLPALLSVIVIPVGAAAAAAATGQQALPVPSRTLGRQA